MVSCTLTLQTFAAAAIDIFRSSSDISVALYLLILLQSSVVIIHHVICIHTINLSEEGKQPPKRDSRVCLHCCIAFGSPQAVCALGLRCIVDVEFSRWRRRSRNFPRGTQRGYSSKPLNITLLNVFSYLNGRYRHVFIP